MSQEVRPAVVLVLAKITNVYLQQLRSLKPHISATHAHFGALDSQDRNPDPL